MKGWPSVEDLLRNAAPSQRPEIERAAARLGRPRSVLPAPLAEAPATTQVAKVIDVASGPVMNKTETRYHQRLLAEGLRPRFAAITLCLTSSAGRRIRYTPDFLVVRQGGHLVELVEVKGAYVYDDAKIKFALAVEQWGEVYAFTWAQWKRGEWTLHRHARRHPVAG